MQQPAQQQQQPAVQAAPADEEPRADFAGMSINAPRSTFKFNGRSKMLKTIIETESPISFSISEDQPGSPGPREWGDPQGAIGKFASFTVIFGPLPAKPGKVSGFLHQSNPYYHLDSGWAYFAGSGAMGETTRVRTSPDSTEYVIQIDDTVSPTVHRVINVSTNPAHTVRIICPANDTGGVVHTLNRCGYVEFAADNSCVFTIGQVSTSDPVKKFLTSIGLEGICP